MQNAIKNTDKSTYIIKLGTNVPNLTIYRNSQPYYFRELPPNEDTINLNLKHSGIYSFSTPFEIVEKKPLIVNMPITEDDLPKPEREYNFPQNWEKNIEMGHTPARMLASHGLVQTGENWSKMPYEMRIYILLHEMAHSKYKTEWKADTLALYMFCKLGYNHSQAMYSLTKILNPIPANLERIKNIFKYIKK